MQNMNGKVKNMRLCWDFVHYCLGGPVAYENLGTGGTGSCGKELVGETGLCWALFKAWLLFGLQITFPVGWGC